MTTVEEVIARTAQPVLEFSRGWMMNPATSARGAELQLEATRGFWVCGRGGVLGDVDADVVAAGVGFMHPAKLRPIWEARHNPAAELAAAYGACCTNWGEAALRAVPEADLRRANELFRTVIDAALPTTGALFSGWRAMPQPASAGGAAALSLHVLRELRGGVHITAVLASGLSPMESALAATPPRGGAAWAEGLGWSPPFPDPDALAAKRAAAEALTSSLCAPAYSALPEGVRDEFIACVLALRTAIG